MPKPPAPDPANSAAGTRIGLQQRAPVRCQSRAADARPAYARATLGSTGLQHTLGNRAFGDYVASAASSPLRRAPLTPEEQAQDLTNAPYSGNERLQSAYDNSPLMSLGENGPAVALLQQGLIDDGILLPVTTQNGTALPDGDFGSETARGVREFQQRHGLGVDGIVGRQTLGQLDALSAPQTQTQTATPPQGTGTTETTETSQTGSQQGIPSLEDQLAHPEHEPGDAGGTSMQFGEGDTASGLLPVPWESEGMVGLLETMPRETLDLLCSSSVFLDTLQAQMSPEQFGRAAACFCLTMPAGATRAAEAKTEALRVMGVMLGHQKDLARSAIQSIRAVVIPANRLLTDVPPFQAKRGQRDRNTPFEVIRGYTHPVGAMDFCSFPEDDLLHIPATVAYTAPSGQSMPLEQADPGTSVSGHEFAHGLHDVVRDNPGSIRADVVTPGQPNTDIQTIQQHFDEATARGNDPNYASPNDVWIDGRQGCYASESVDEFFAELSNAYLGVNAGPDVNTGDQKKNGRYAVQSLEPEVCLILDRMYGHAELASTSVVG